MRKTLAVVTLTAALTGGTATLAYADDTVAPIPAAQESVVEEQDSDNTGLWGLLGLLGLAGLAKRKEPADAGSARR